MRHRDGDECAHRVVGQVGDHRPGRADGRDDHAAADEHRAGRRGSVVVASRSRSIPTLKIALSEGGTGWIPYFLDRVDRTYEMHSTWTHQDFGGKLPSEVFREHFMTCFISDPIGVKNRHEIGIDNICWEMDYPHSDSMWPGAPEELGAVFDTYNVPDDEINKITHENAMRCTTSSRSPTSPRTRPPSAPCANPSQGTTSRPAHCPSTKDRAPASPTSRPVPRRSAAPSKTHRSPRVGHRLGSTTSPRRVPRRRIEEPKVCLAE